MSRQTAIGREDVVGELETAETKAWEALTRWRWLEFGMHAARWSFLAMIWRRVSGEVSRNPFAALVDEARRRFCIDCGERKATGHLCAARMGVRTVEEQDGPDAQA